MHKQTDILKRRTEALIGEMNEARQQAVRDEAAFFTPQLRVAVAELLASAESAGKFSEALGRLRLIRTSPTARNDHESLIKNLFYELNLSPRE